MGAARMGRALRDVEEGLLEVSQCRAGRQVGGGELVQPHIDRSDLVSCRQCCCGPRRCSQHQRTGQTCRAQCTASW